MQPTIEGTEDAWYSYAVVRVVPRVERGEFLNVGVVLFCRTLRFLETRIELDEPRLLALSPIVDAGEVGRHLDAFQAVSMGAAGGGPVAALPQSERFSWLTSPRSTVIQTSPVHIGQTDNPSAALEELMKRFVRLARGAGAAP